MGYLSNIMIEGLKFFAVFGGYGWGIVWLTIAVNLALYPLTLSSIKSMGAMQRIQPKIKKLQEKHKDDPKKLQQETMGLYKGEGINPFGGCLPVLLKIPFFLALFWAFQSTAFMEIASNPANNTGILWVDGRVAASQFQSAGLVKKLEKKDLLVLDKKASSRAGEEKFVWNAVLKVGDKSVKDLLRYASPEKVSDRKDVALGFAKAGINLSEDEAGNVIAAWDDTNNLAKPERLKTPFGAISLFALLIGITTYMMQKTMPAAGGGQAQMMTMFMPVFITFISWNFPAGVQLYWLISNLVGAIQQYLITRRTGRVKEEKEDTL